MASPELPDPPKVYKWDVRVASPRKLFRDLHDFLDEHEYEHKYEPLKSDPDAIDGLAIFKSELLGRKDTPRRDWAYLIFGIILVPTILLTTLGIRFIEQSRYTYRTVASIGVQGEAYLAKESVQDIGQNEILDVVSDARVTLNLKAGAARGDYGIWRPTDNKHDLTRLEEELNRLEEALSEYFAGIDQSGNED
jgi:hypothetical protein